MANVYLVIRISDLKVISRHFKLENARQARESLRPHGASLMYEIYKYLE